MGCEVRTNKCTGGSVADSVESLIGALFLTTDNLMKVLEWIDEIKLVPLEALNQVKIFKNFRECTFDNLRKIDLQKLPFKKHENLSTLFTKYFEIPESECDIPTKKRLNKLIHGGEPIGEFGQRINPISHLHGQMFVSQALRRLERVQSEILGYQFKDPLLLLEALTHRSGQSYYKLQRNYEKLELLGDAILDYLANSNLLRFTLFERYLSFTTDYKHSEDFNCADAHQAKIQLVKNELLSKLTVLMGLHKYAIFYNSSDNELSSKDVDDYLQFSHKPIFDLN